MLDAAAGVTAAGGVQLAITPCRPSPAQGTPGTLAPLSRNSLWDAKYSEVFASPLPEWRVALGLSPGLPVLLVYTPMLCSSHKIMQSPCSSVLLGVIVHRVCVRSCMRWHSLLSSGPKVLS